MIGGFAHGKEYAMLLSQSQDGIKNSSCRLWFPCSLWLAPVNAFQQHRQLRPRQTHLTTGGLRPDEAPTLQPLLKKTQTVTIEPQQLDQVAALAAKYKYMPGKWSLLEHRLYDRRESLKAATQIRKPRGNPDPRTGPQLDHRSRLPSTMRTSSGSIPASTRIEA